MSSPARASAANTAPRSPHSGEEINIRIPVRDGLELAATLYIPAGKPQPCLLEALPYRKDDATAHSADTYRRLRDLHQFAVCRVDIRGTGSSAGVAIDEYSTQEHDDLCDVIAWLADQTWCDGAVGMWGMSYSGFNALQVAARRPPALRAVCAMYATDDRWSDDVHWRGGALKTLDLIDYGNYMTSMNLLPPVPAVYGPGWREEWARRVNHAVPWVLSWIQQNSDGPYWRHGSMRDEPSGGWGRISCPVMLVAGWADGYRNNTFRTVSSLREARIPHKVVVGPWAHESPDTAQPGPRIDIEHEMVSWWDTWLRRDGGGHRDSFDVFVRQSTRPRADLDEHRGYWTDGTTTETQSACFQLEPRRRSPLVVQPDVGVTALTDCAVELPWGQPTDQAPDNLRSLVWDWPWLEPELAVWGYPDLSVAVAVTGRTGMLSAKLCDVFPDGTSTLISRGTVDLALEAPLDTDRTTTVTLRLDACAHRLETGHRLRLAISGSDWPNTAAAPSPFAITIEGGNLRLPIARPQPYAEEPFRPSRAGHTMDRTATAMSVQVTPGGPTSVNVGYESLHEIPFGGSLRESHSGCVTVDPATFDQTVNASCAHQLSWPSTTIRTQSDLEVDITRDRYDVRVKATITEGDEARSVTWIRTYPRYSWSR